MRKLDINKSTLRMVQKELKRTGDEFTLGFLAGDRENDRIAIVDIYIPKQRRKIYQSSVSARELAKTLFKMMSNGLQCVGVAIYQPHFKLYLSAVNENMMKKLCKLSDTPLACLVCNKEPKKVLWRMF